MNDITPKEAIANLNHIYGMVSPDIQRSLDVAIKALERPQGDCISREGIRKALNEAFDCEDATKYGNKNAEQQSKSYSTLMLYEIANIVEDCCDNAPTVDLWQMRQEATENALKKAEVLYGSSQGSWEKDNIGIYCSVCKRHLDVETPFCPLCGADMKGGAE